MDSQNNSSELDICMDLKDKFDACEPLEDKQENLSVFCRIRPMLKSEEEQGYKECVWVIDEERVRAAVPSSSVKFKNGQEMAEDFQYTSSFGPEIGQFSFFLETMMNIMQGFLEGQNGLIFSYGITNSGKTYTLQGNESDPGVIPMGLHLFFASIEQQIFEDILVKPVRHADFIILSDKERTAEKNAKKDLMHISEQEPNIKSANSTCNSNSSFGNILCQTFYDGFKLEPQETTLPPEEMIAAQSAQRMRDLGRQSANAQTGHVNIWISFIEIYNEYIYDLLHPHALQRNKLELKEDQNGDIFVKGATEVCVSNSAEAIKLLQMGRQNLRISSTKLNYQSSRSHCIYTIKIVRIFDKDFLSARINRLSFCDLAGSERAEKAETSGMRIKEGGYINKSLLVLGRCLDQLRLNQTSKDKKMIPFRESKLTRLFSGFFSGKGRAVMIANASPCEYTFDETLNVLRFSALAKQLILNDEYLSKATNYLQNFEKQIARTSQNESMDDSISQELEEKNDIIREMLDLATELKDSLAKEKKEKVELEQKIREELCKDFSEYTDQRIAKQIEIADKRVEGEKRIFEIKLKNIKEEYEERIKELEAQLDYEESSVDESMDESMNKTNLSVNEDADASKVGIMKKRNSSIKGKRKLSEDLFKNVDSLQSSEIITENKTLKLELDTIRNELEASNKQLEQYTVVITSLKSEKSAAENSCKDLEIQLQEANESITQYKSNKLNFESLENQLNKTKEEKKELEEGVASLIEKLAASSCDCAQLKEAKLEAEFKSSEQISALLLEKQNLEQECRELVSKLEAAGGEDKVKVVKLEAECSELKADKDLLECLQKDLQQKIEEQKKKIEEMESESMEQKSSNSNLSNELVSLKEALEQLKEDYELSYQENEKLKSSNQAASLVNENLKQVELDLENVIKEKETQLADMIQRQEEFNKEYSTLKEKHETTLEEISSIKQEKELIELKCSSLTSLKKETADTEMKIQKLLVKLEEKEIELKTKDNTFMELKEKHEDLTNEIFKMDQLKSEFQELKSSNHTLSEKNKELQTSLLDAENKLETTIKEMSCIKQEKESVESKCKSLTSVNEEYAEDSMKSQELLRKLEQTETELKTKDALLKQLNKKCEDLNKDVLNMNELKTDFEKLKKSNQILNEKNKELQTNLLNAEEELGAISNELDSLRKEKDDVATRFSTSNQKEKAKFEVELKDLGDQVVSLEKTLKKKECRLNELDNIHSNLKEELEKSVNSAKEKDLKIEQLKTEYSSCENNCAKLKDSNASLQSEFDAIQKELVSVKNSYFSSKTKVNEIQEECAEYKNHCDEISEKILQLNQVIDTKDESIKSASEKFAALKKASTVQLETINDLKRQIKEREASIEELERALQESQKLSQETNAQLETKVKGKTKVSNTSTEGQKRSLSPSPKVSPKRRRVLRGKAIQYKEDSENITDMESLPSTSKASTRGKKKTEKSTSTKASAKSKKEVEKPTLPLKTTSRRKLVEDNQSPVQKAIAFVNSKVRNIAETVSNLPSPRVTRNRRKLFNIEDPNTNPDTQKPWKL